MTNTLNPTLTSGDYDVTYKIRNADGEFLGHDRLSWYAADQFNKHCHWQSENSVERVIERLEAKGEKASVVAFELINRCTRITAILKSV